MAHAPPVPPDQQSDIVEGASSPPSKSPEIKKDPAGGTADWNLSERGQVANTIQNITNQGHQQDR